MVNVIKAFDRAVDRAVSHPAANKVMAALGAGFLAISLGLLAAEKVQAGRSQSEMPAQPVITETTSPAPAGPQ